MATASIPVDLFNPGQVFACLGFLEAADILLGDAEGGFDWATESQVRFYMYAKGENNPFEKVLTFLEEASIYSLAPERSKNSTDSWGVKTIQLAEDDPFPFPDPDTPATLPAILTIGNQQCIHESKNLILSHWSEGKATGRDPVKFWGGSGGYPGVALTRDALRLINGKWLEFTADPFMMTAPQSSSFRFDWRRDYIPLDIGFSINSHNGKIFTVGFPLVELLAAIGLSNARPSRISVLEYSYSVIGLVSQKNFYDPNFHRIALGNTALPFPQRVFRMYLGWPSQEGQARCIKNVIEENRK